MRGRHAGRNKVTQCKDGNWAKVSALLMFRGQYQCTGTSIPKSLICEDLIDLIQNRQNLLLQNIPQYLLVEAEVSVDRDIVCISSRNSR
jgi:hypothetical protein